MLPFKKREMSTLDQFVSTLDPAPCGQQKDHYYWMEFERRDCPHCDRNKRRKDELDKEDRMARKIAEHVQKILKGQ